MGQVTTKDVGLDDGAIGDYLGDIEIDENIESRIVKLMLTEGRQILIDEIMDQVGNASGRINDFIESYLKEHGV
jgi:hypothetical protein